ncbi:hypothetical protein SAMN05660479_02710 [Microbulbifer thermotolerans]|nr:hypothetical protein SAMN05660479_02710 [Microbulbifer thermotolerans]
MPDTAVWQLNRPFISVAKPMAKKQARLLLTAQISTAEVSGIVKMPSTHTPPEARSFFHKFCG